MSAANSHTHVANAAPAATSMPGASSIALKSTRPATPASILRAKSSKTQYTPKRAASVYLIDEVHMLSAGIRIAQDAGRAAAREVPAATTDPQKLPVTVLALPEIQPQAPGAGTDQRPDEEHSRGRNIRFEASAAELARAADGSLRDGLSLLDQAIAYGAGSVRAAEVRAMLGTIERGRLSSASRAPMPATAALLAETAFPPPDPPLC
jgi:DNA polymerase-3 subunit gamma/tau